MPLTGIRAVLNVSNIENCISFYRDIIEFEIHTYSEADKWVLLTKDGQELMLQEIKDFKPSEAIALCLYLDDLSSFTNELKSKIPDLEDPQSSLAFLYGLTLIDPDGNQLRFAQAPQ
jgi:catechol-2,3-dioxygenase